MVWKVIMGGVLVAAGSAVAFQSIQDPNLTLNKTTVATVAGETLTIPAESRATVLIFLESSCPIGNRFAPEIARIHATYSKKSVSVFHVYPGAHATKEDVLAHASEYSLKAPAILDPEHKLAKGVKATVTPEAAVIDASGKLLYRGRINDLYLDHSRTRLAPTRHDLRVALDEILAGKKVSVPLTTAVGCFIQ